MDLIVKDNALINASYNLELTEQRIVLLAILQARETGKGVDANTHIEIHASDYMQKFNVVKSVAYRALKDAVNNLFERKFSFEQDNKGKRQVVKSRWVSRIAYTDELATLEITFAPDVVPLITRLEKEFTSYHLQQVVNLTSKYAVRLYELLMCWQELKKTPVINIKDLRWRLGVEDNEYKVMGNFKERVLEHAITRINEHTNIVVKYQQFKKGRSIVGFAFTFKYKNPQKVTSGSLKDKNTIDMFTGLTEKQITFFAHKLAHDNSFASRHAEVGEEYSNLEARLRKKLADQTFVEKISKDLVRLGFK